MKPIVCIYCEGSDAKLAVVEKGKSGIKILRLTSISTTQNANVDFNKTDHLDNFDSNFGEDLSFDSIDSISEPGHKDLSDVAALNSVLFDFKIPTLSFIPILTEPTVNFINYEGVRDSNHKKMIQMIKSSLLDSKGIVVTTDNIDVMEINERTNLGVYLEGELHCVDMIERLAAFNKRRFLKIPTIKTAELSLAYYISKSNKFFPEDYSLIVYIGKEYSKLIFLEGQQLKHIGTTLDIGTKNLHTYDVYFSKILLEMENGGIPKLDNIILCGEDRSENLILSFFGTFPEANVTELLFNTIDSSNLNEEETKNLALYAIPLSVGVEYFDELDKLTTGINFLPRRIQENQKLLQFGWHSYALLILLFAAAFFFTFTALSNVKDIKELDYEINNMVFSQKQNQALVDQITPLDSKINSFDATQSILDSAVVGAGMWNQSINRISDFVERRRSFWVSRLEPVSEEEVQITGFSLNRSVLTEFAEFNNASLLKNINYEPLRDKNAFSYSMKFSLIPKPDSLNTQ